MKTFQSIQPFHRCGPFHVSEDQRRGPIEQLEQLELLERMELLTLV
jgi:hypothetical protein